MRDDNLKTSVCLKLFEFGNFLILHKIKLQVDFLLLTVCFKVTTG